MMTSINLTANTTLFHTLLTVYIHTHSERAFSFLLVQSMRRSTLGDRSFPVAAARAWNALPQHVQNAPSLSVFRREMKTVLFRLSFPDVIWQCTVLYLRARRSVLICHHVLAATNWFCWHCTLVLQQQCDAT